ncbi:hypothetical protein [Rubrimonas cliftonensis]|uniref:Uncharacterized protein n=1 Tax=Rubrimonas cliftonensis TaxID=89524 RepID=A0A1H4FUW4_9RHOB|nr:hypothetical protein [Rubrimonas cliftonensis]SEB00887.1 hypothetical protein SAMN05444370_1293 [Rubrimonas cliftonensis]
MTRRRRLLFASALATLPALAQAGEIAFAPVPIAADDAAKRQVIATSSVTINGTEYPIGYTVLASSGDRIGDGVFAALKDRQGDLVRSADGALKAVSTKPVDSSAYGGLRAPCAGAVTRWTTHLGSDEHSADARGHVG